VNISISFRSVSSVLSVVKTLLSFPVLYFALSTLYCALFGNNFPYSRQDNAHYAAAAPSSPVVAAFAPIRWRVSSLSPFFVAQKLQLSGCPRASRHSLRRQFSRLCHNRHRSIQLSLL
jgi:hypothetical protein